MNERGEIGELEGREEEAWEEKGESSGGMCWDGGSSPFAEMHAYSPRRVL